MSRKRTTYSADFKAKLVLEVLEGEKTLNEIASKNMRYCSRVWLLVVN